MDLETYINDNDISHLKLAKSCGLDHKTIWRILQGTTPTLATAVRLEEYSKKRITCKDLLEYSMKKKDKVKDYLARNQ